MRRSEGSAEDLNPTTEEPGVVRLAIGATTAVVARHGNLAPESRTCLCGCGQPVPMRRPGRPRLFATDACRAAVYRRRRAEVPADLPRQSNDHGRRSLAAVKETAVSVRGEVTR